MSDLKPPTQPQTFPAFALVTGAGHRLGKAIALELARQGMAVGIHYYHSREAAEETAAEVRKLGQPAALFQADLRQASEIENLFTEVSMLPYRLEVLVNSAAEMQRGSLMTLSSDDWDSTLALNLRAPMLCSQAAARLMGKNGGLIVNLSDAGAGKTWTGFPAYIVSKAGVESLTRLLARALAPYIRVNAIAPGLILPSTDTSPKAWAKLVQRLPMQRPGGMEEITQTLVFLLNNRYITGEIIAVDGGYRLG